MGQSPASTTCNIDGVGIPLLNGPTEFGSHHPLAVQFTTDAKKIAKPGDILFCVRGSTTGRMNWSDQIYAIGRGIGAIRHKQGIEYQPLVRGVIECELSDLLTQATGSTFPNVSASQLSKIRWPALDDAEQRRIAHILGTLDDKIENNRKTAKTLEAMAQAIFQSWFVDFDPVRAKMAGESKESICKRLKLTPEILDLFPDRLVDSELGEIPDGWVDGSLGNICSRRSVRIGNRDAKVLSAVTEGRLAISDDYFTKRVYSKDIKNYLAVEWYDFAYNPSRINIGSIGMLESHFLGAVSPVYVVFRPVEGYQQFIKFYLRLATTKQWITNFASGSVRQSLSYDDFAAIPSAIPPKVIIDVFSSIHDFMKHATDCLYEHAIKASDLRDTLLPKLISGEIRVPEAEHLIENMEG